MSDLPAGGSHITFSDNGTIADFKSRFNVEAAAVRWMTATSSMIDTVGPLFMDALKRRAPYHPIESGGGTQHPHLRDSFAWHRKMMGPGFMRMEISNKAPYFPFVVKGTKPHRIAPRPGHSMLAWHDSAGAAHFARFVNHPGTKPNDFVRRTMTEVRSLLVAAYAAKLREAYIR